MNEQIPTVQSTWPIDTNPEIVVGSIVDDRYGIEEVLKESLASRVYLAQDHENKFQGVVIKMPCNEDPDCQTRFMRENEILPQLEHPNIVEFRANGVHSSNGGLSPYLVTEYLEGGDLNRGRNRSDVVKTLGYLADAASGLLHVHEAGLVHRDIKPGNIFVGQN